MILIGIGSNLSGGGYKTSVDVCEAALSALADKGITVLRHSQWFESEPVPVSEQPWFINGVASVETPLSAVDLLSCLHEIEDSFGRIRRQRNEARILDLDLLAFGSDIIEIPNVLASREKHTLWFYWQEKLFAFLVRNYSANFNIEFYQLPYDRTVAIGTYCLI